MSIGKCGVILFFLSVMVVTSSGQKFNYGSCPTTLRSVATPALKIKKLVGVWKEYARNKAHQQNPWKCATYTITEITARVRYAVAVGGRRRRTNTALRTAGTIHVGGSTGKTATAATFLTFTLTDRLSTTSLNYYFIYLNDECPTVFGLYACSDHGLGRLESAILLVKSGATDANIIEGLKALAENGFPAGSLYFNYQADCLVI